MKLFQTRQIREAWAYAMADGQALHLMTGQWARCMTGPTCFRNASEFAHLFDQNADRLRETAVSLGVKVIVVSKPGTESQHVDLCGAPLKRAKAMCQEAARLW